MEKTLRRSFANSVFLGVCGGLGEYINMDPVLVRVLFVLAFFFGFGSPLLVYIVLAFLMPKAY
ncbi:PspC domain-containing protein [Cytophagaceae bacterium DM2B3-1]|uniref:PspC domain-containing protein n=2 Tax=Xanthocytophaga TaxID=3078918 RepID=A0AAE3QPL4_9BACT|nr:MULTISPECIES: PspC domain-containing protein [Xanthocytophaga]MDJ1472581.1 PspC domain-containing protein [Xanthocytophaga flavus]MDJ1481138.1 PspC domain-containing protein [Xanthocytophaga flavus]MDJ1498941.1 PspC domain-containing protein [Xanthocytophaga flavus]MDJ1504750.1 PspC domain-containing protein [Xanthocytophaga agilis]